MIPLEARHLLQTHLTRFDGVAERRILVHRGRESFPMRHGVEAMPLLEAMSAVSVAVNT